MLGRFSSGDDNEAFKQDCLEGIEKFPSLDAFNRLNISQECYRYAVWGTGLNEVPSNFSLIMIFN